MSMTSKAVLRGPIASNGCNLPIRAVMRSSAAEEIAILCIVACSTSRVAIRSSIGLRSWSWLNVPQKRLQSEIDCGFLHVCEHIGPQHWQYGRELGILDRSRRHLYRRDRQ